MNQDQFFNWLKRLAGPKRVPIPIPPTGDGLTRLAMLHNQFRAAHGRAPLTLHPALMASAATHAADMATRGVLSHTGSDGSSPFRRMNRAGYEFSAASENIAAGQTSPEQVMSDWESDPPHRGDILGPYVHLGVARAGNYWVADFGTPGS